MTMLEKIPYTKPSITDLELSFVSDAAAHGWGPKCYEYIERFEREFADYLGVKHAIATSSCTGAITLAVASLGLGPGDEVILADTNWIASVAPLIHAGVKPIFVDIDPTTWCINVEEIRRVVTKDSKAILATHLYGNLVQMNELRSIAKEFNLFILEDAAEAIGSTYFDKRAGSFGDFGFFSFHGTKTISTGEGGMLVTNDSLLYERALTLSNHGRARNEVKQFWPHFVGYKFKMSNLQAALGCAQLSRVDQLVARKREILANYVDFLSNYPYVQMNQSPLGSSTGAWMPTLVLSTDFKHYLAPLMKSFRSSGIDARPFFWPLSSLPMFESAPKNTNAYSISERALNLPSYHDITQGELERVFQAVSDVLPRIE